jgi:hypothetical protein
MKAHYRRRLEQFEEMLRDIKNKVPTVEVFDMNAWRDTFDPEENDLEPILLLHTIKEGSCGTAACALGSAGLYGPLRAKGLKTTEDEVVYENETGFEAGAAFFGISITQSFWLFHASNYHPAFNETYDNPSNFGAYHIDTKVTPVMVADRVRRILDGTAPTWSANNG